MYGQESIKKENKKKENKSGRLINYNLLFQKDN